MEANMSAQLNGPVLKESSTYKRPRPKENGKREGANEEDGGAILPNASEVVGDGKGVTHVGDDGAPPPPPPPPPALLFDGEPPVPDDAHVAAPAAVTAVGIGSTLEAIVPRRHSESVKRKWTCTVDGCPKYAVAGGICIAHGAVRKKQPKRVCEVEGCKKWSQYCRRCVKHGARPKRCNYEGCQNAEQKGGVCFSHGAIKPRCRTEGCNNQIIQGGVCRRHGAKVQVKYCQVEGCTKNRVRRGLCYAHGNADNLRNARCIFGDCTKIASKAYGTCEDHRSGQSEVTKKMCSIEGCQRQRQVGKLCQTHLPPGARRHCRIEGCIKQPIRGGVCISHGAKKRRCSKEGCDKGVIQGGLCAKHGAKIRRCRVEGCLKQVQMGGTCHAHFKASSTTEQDEAELQCGKNMQNVEYKPVEGGPGMQGFVADVVKLTKQPDSTKETL